MRTNISNIYAAGDVVEVDKNVLCLWNVAKQQGKVAGSNMAGKDMEYKPLKSSTLLTIENYPIFSTGEVQSYHHCVEYSDEDKCFRLYITDNKLTGAVLIGDISKLPKVKRAINDGKSVNYSPETDALKMLEEL